MSKTEYIAKNLGARRRLPWKYLVGSLLGIAVLVWLLSDQHVGKMWHEVRNADPLVLLACLPLVLINMLLRAVRWRALLDTSPKSTSYWSVFSALMIGYLANNVLPARAGDLVRIYSLSSQVKLSRSYILATVFIERLLDMAGIILVLALATITSPLPDWLRKGATVLAIATLISIIALIILGIAGERIVWRLICPLAVRAPSLANRLQVYTTEFILGIQNFRKPTVIIVFFASTAGIWILEIAIVLFVANAFSLPLAGFDAAILMLFSLFSSLIPALPGQIGTFELAMVTGLQFLGHRGATVLPFAFMLHIVLLGGTALIGSVCLVYSGLPLKFRMLSNTHELCNKTKTSGTKNTIK
jgi:uncharacterized protein (TIRG00374 family)